MARVKRQNIMEDFKREAVHLLAGSGRTVGQGGADLGSGKSTLEQWKMSRSGAWAGRGFHYQHLVATFILLRQWAGLAPTGSLVPEGFEDCVIELAGCDIWIQVKSRKEGTFSAAYVDQVRASMGSKVHAIGNPIRTIVVLEQTAAGFPERGLDDLFAEDDGKVLICSNPGDQCLALLVTKLGVAEVIADGITSDLYRLVAEASQANTSRSYYARRRISTTEVERRIFERLEAEDPSAIDAALISGALEPVDCTTPVDEPGFYQGVKVNAGHVAAGLVLDRPIETQGIVSALKERRSVLISGPSGAGKSALAWLVVKEISRQFRVFQVSGLVGSGDAEDIVRFVRARQPTAVSPIGLIFDEVGPANAGLWSALVRECWRIPAVHLLGAIRQEDLALIATRTETEVVPISLSDDLAEAVWAKLAERGETTWKHWREPFVQSGALMLEYVHLLTSGKRLLAIVEEQVHQREQEGRDAELAIIRGTSVLCSHGGEVDAAKLIGLLGLKPEAVSGALKRLIDEHLVRESRSGVLGGLHLLRSAALERASHDEMIFLSEDSLWQALPAATNETLPRIIQSLFTETEAEPDRLQMLADKLAANPDAEFWTSAFTGLALATIEQWAAQFISVLQDYELPPAQWSLASMFGDSGIDIPDLQNSGQWPKLKRAVLDFREAPKADMRAECLKRLPPTVAAPAPRGLHQATAFLACLTPICGGEAVPMKLQLDLRPDAVHDIDDVAALLATAYLISPDFAKCLVEQLGGEPSLFARFRSQTPWLSNVTVDPKGAHGKTVRANWHLVNGQTQVDPHAIIRGICETLIALSPTSDAAASDAVTALGIPITIGDFQPWSMNIPRSNLPVKARVAWNIAFRHIVLAQASSDTFTDYAHRMSGLVCRTEKAFRSYTEKWIKGKINPGGESLVSEAHAISEEVDKLAYAVPKNAFSPRVSTVSGEMNDEVLGSLLSGVLGNLLGRLKPEGAKAAAAFASDLADKLRLQGQSDMWRVMSAPPVASLNALAVRLADVSAILHELAHDPSQEALQRIGRGVKGASLGNAIRAAARHCRAVAEKRFSVRIRLLEQALTEQGLDASCITRSLADNSNEVSWPPRAVAILLELHDFQAEADHLVKGLAIAQQQLKTDWSFRVVPVINGKVVAQLALAPSSSFPLPDQDFEKEWRASVSLPFLTADLVLCYDRALEACIVVSALVACRDLDDLHDEEEQALSLALSAFHSEAQKLNDVTETTGSEILELANVFLLECYEEVSKEFDSAATGQPVQEPFCAIADGFLTGQPNERSAHMAALRLLLLEAEARQFAS